MLVYKILRRDGRDKLVSMIALPPLRLEYQVGQITRPRIGLLLAFETLADARRFREPFRLMSATASPIFRCETDEFTPIKLLIHDPDMDEHRTETFWKIAYQDMDDVIDRVGAAFLAPEGTVGCPYLKPISDVTGR